MKTEFMHIEGKGMCIVISDFNSKDLNFMKKQTNGIFSDPIVIADEIRGRRKIGAIKEIRAQTGWGLKESKDYIDKYLPIGHDLRDIELNRIADRFINDHTLKDYFEDDEFEI